MLYKETNKKHIDLIDFNKSKILIVDDASLNRELIYSYLEFEGYLCLEMAENGEKALEKIKKNKPDLIILDLIMPIMGGIELIKILKKDPMYSQIPIIVQTAISEPEQQVEAWNAGANDILIKPVHRIELLSRVKVQLKNIHMINELESYQLMVDTDIEQALYLQQSLLPTEEYISFIENKYNICIKSIFLPSRFLSGDMWGIYDIDDDSFGVWICDFSGKGIRAALNVFRLHTLLDNLLPQNKSPEKVMSTLGNKLSDLLSIGQFATFFLGIVNTKKNTLTYSSASATHPILYNNKEKNYTLVDGTGIPLGVTSDAIYEKNIVSLNVNQSLILYSDLLWEDKSIPGINFRENNLSSFVNELNGSSIFETVNNQLVLLGNIKLEDDLTLVEIKIKNK